VLNAQPTANVMIGLASSEPAEGTISVPSVTFTPSNWNAPQTVTVTGVDDARADGNQVYRVVTSMATSLGSDYAGMNPADVTLTNTDNDTARVTVSPVMGLTTTEAGGTDTFTIVLNSQPNADVIIGLSSSDTGEGTVSPSSVTFTSVNWNAAQTVTVTGVNDDLGDGSQPYTIVTAAAASLDTGYSGLNPANVEVTNTDNDTAGFTVAPTSGLVTTEAGGTATFTIVLNSQPSADVVIPLSVSDMSEASISPASVTFTGVNWAAPRTITVTGLNDDLADGTQPYTIVTGAATGSDSTGYVGLDPVNVAAATVDNDTAGVTVTPTSGLVTTEGATTATFTIALNSQPTASVTIALSSSDLTEGTVSPASVTFTTANWATAQTVTVTGVNDALADGNQSYSIVTAAATSTDTTGYNGIDAANVSVSNTDNDSAGITVTPTSGLVTTEAGGTATFTVVLNAQPSADVTIGLTSSDLTEGTVSPASLTFTNGNWATAQTVTVTGVNDALDDGNQSYSIVTAAAVSTDPAYSTVDASNVTVSNTDNDTFGITVTPTSGLVTTEAGGTATFTIVLDSQPTADVRINVDSSDTTEGTVSAGSVTFTSANWNVAQTVTVTGVDDAVGDGDVAYTIITSPAISTDTVGYSGLNPANVSVTNRDDDVYLVSGIDFNCALKPDGSIYCWGHNNNGQLADGTTTDRLSPTLVSGGLVFSTIASLHYHTCGLLRSTGAPYCWGLNDWGQLGDGTMVNRTAPTAVLGGMTFSKIATGGSHVCALTSAGDAYCWGLNVSGQLGNGTHTASITTPVAVSGGLKFTQLWLGGDQTCGLTAAGAAYCWGRNVEGELGDGTTTERTVPTAVSGGLTFASLSGGWMHTCGLTAAGALHCWGANGAGQLGDASTTQRNAPVAVSGGLTFASVARGDFYGTCGVVGTAAYCWGNNGNGQVGDNTTTNRTAPTAVMGVVNFGLVNQGVDHSCGQSTAGAVYCWGSNGNGRLGDTTTTTRPLPTLVTIP
jgi:alpha-tubulin suppressor-like RCC1 family protein